MFIITSGRVEVFQTHDGRKVPLTVLGDGEPLGETALLDDKPRSPSAVAPADTEYLLLTRDRFRTLVNRDPGIIWPIVAPVVRRMRDQNRRRTDPAGSTDASRSPTCAGTSSEDAVPAETRVERLAPDPEQVSTSRRGRATNATSESFPKEAASDGSGTDVLRTPYALMMTGAIGFGESVRLCEVFLRSLDESSGLAGGRPMADVVRDLPASLATAGEKTWDRGRRLPSKLLDVFRDHLRSNWRGED